MSVAFVCVVWWWWWCVCVCGGGGGGGGVHRWPVDTPHKWLVMRKMFQFDDVIMDDIVFRKLRSLGVD